MKKISLRYNYYAFFDVREYLADRLFIQHKVRVWFDGEYEKEGSKYIAVLCHVRKKDTNEFLSALDNLNRTMLICGYTDYEREVESFMKKIEEGRDILCRRK